MDISSIIGAAFIYFLLNQVWKAVREFRKALRGK